MTHRLRATVALLAIGLLLTVVSPPTARAASADDGAEEDTTGTPRVELVSQTTWIDPDGEVRVRLDVSAAAPDDRLVVTFHPRLPGRYALADAMDGVDLGRPMDTILDGTVAELDPDGDGRIDAALGLRSTVGDGSRLLVSREGLHPVQVDLTAADGTDRDGFVTLVARLPDSVEQTLGVAVVQPLDGVPRIDPDGTTTIGDAARTRLTRAVGSFSEEPESPITYRITPETVESLIASGNPLDLELVDGLADLLTDGHLAASPFVRLDPDALVDADLAHLVDDQLARGAAVTVAHLDAHPDDTTWIADPELGPVGLAALVDAGVEDVIVPHESLVGERPDLLVQPFRLRDARGRTVTALTTDPRLQSHIGRTGSPVLDAQNVLAELSSIWFERPAYARATAVVLPADVADRTTIDALRRGIASSPLLTADALPAVIDAADPAAAGGIDETVESDADRLTLALAEPRVDQLGNGYRSLLGRTRADVDSFATIFSESLVVDSYRSRIATSASADLTVEERRGLLDAIRHDISVRTGNIAMPERGAITLPSRDGVIPLTLVNGTGAPASVVVRFASDKLEFPDGDRLEVTLTEVHTPVELRVRVLASGAFPLEMSMEAPDGHLVLVDSRYTVRSTAVSGLGVALSIAAVGVLGAWWLRTAQRARAARRDAN